MLSLEFRGGEVSQGSRRPFLVEERDVFLDEVWHVVAIADAEVAEQLLLRPSVNRLHRPVVPGRPARRDLEDTLYLGCPEISDLVILGNGNRIP